MKRFVRPFASLATSWLSATSASGTPLKLVLGVMKNAFLEPLASRATEMEAEEKLIALGASAVPILDALLSGQAVNAFGVPYRRLGSPVRAALEVVCRLGPLARPLEHLVTQELRDGTFGITAAQALASLESVNEESIAVLAARLEDGPDVQMETAIALITLGHEQHVAVQAAIARSTRAARAMNRAASFVQKRGRHSP